MPEEVRDPRVIELDENETLIQRCREADDRSSVITHLRTRLELLNALIPTDRDAYERRKAGTLASLGIELSEDGQTEEAVEVTERAAAILNRLSTADPEKYGKDHAFVLDSLAGRYFEAARHDEGLEVARRSVDLLRAASVSEPDLRGNLIESMRTAGKHWAALGRHDEAIDLAHRTLTIADQVVAENGETGHRALVAALYDVIDRLDESDRASETVFFGERLVYSLDQLSSHTVEFASLRLNEMLNLGIRLADIGQHDKAVLCTEEAVRSFQQMEGAEPREHMAALGNAFKLLAVRFDDADRIEDSVGAARSSAGAYEQLARKDPGTYLGDLYLVLEFARENAEKLGRTGEAAELVQYTARAIAELSDGTPAALKAHWKALKSLADWQNNNDRSADGVGTSGEMITLAQQSDPGGADEAQSWLLHSKCLADTGRYSEAIPAGRYAVDVYSYLAHNHPQERRTELALALLTHGNHCTDSGDPASAVPLFERCVQELSELASSEPERFELALAWALNQYSVALMRLGRHDDSERITLRQIGIRERLAECDPAYSGELALALRNLAVALSAAGRHHDALPHARRAVTIYQPLAASEPRLFAELGRAMNTYGESLFEVGEYGMATQTTRQAVDFYEKAPSSAEGVPEGLATSLISLSNHLSSHGSVDESLRCVQRARDILEKLAATRPAEHTDSLAIALHCEGARLAQSGRMVEAEASAARAVYLFDQLAAAMPGGYTSKLLGALRNWQRMLSTLGRHDEAAAAARRLSALS